MCFWIKILRRAQTLKMKYTPDILLLDEAGAAEIGGSIF